MKILTTPNLYNQRKSLFMNAAHTPVQPVGQPEEITSPQKPDVPADPKQDHEKEPAKAG